MRMFVAVLVLCLVWIATAGALDPEPDSRGDAELNWVMNFDWQTEPGVYSVSGGKANFTLGENEVALFGAEAGRFAVELEGAESFRETDAVILKAEGSLADSIIVMAHVTSGFVHDDDWHELNADDLLDAIRENTSRDNAERLSKGHRPVEILGWSQPPTFDAHKKIAYWH